MDSHTCSSLNCECLMIYSTSISWSCNKLIYVATVSPTAYSQYLIYNLTSNFQVIFSLFFSESYAGYVFPTLKSFISLWCLGYIHPLHLLSALSHTEAFHLFLLHTNHLFVLIHHCLAAFFLIFPLSPFSNPEARILLSPTSRCILVANLFSFSHCWISWIDHLFTCRPSTYLILYCFIVILLNTMLSVAVGFHHPPCIWVPSSLSYNAKCFKWSWIGLLRGGFRVAGTAYLRQIGQDKVYLFGELSSQCHVHRQTRSAENRRCLCVLTLFLS